MSMVEGANTGDVEEGSSLSVFMSACGNALVVLAQLCPTAWKSQSETPSQENNVPIKLDVWDWLKHPGLETGHHIVVCCIPWKRRRYKIKKLELRSGELFRSSLAAPSRTANEFNWHQTVVETVGSAMHYWFLLHKDKGYHFKIVWSGYMPNPEKQCYNSWYLKTLFQGHI